VFAACIISAAWLPQLGRADTYDIGVKLYTDINCLFWANEFALLDNGCYGNTYAPNVSKGFKVTIVDFSSPQKFDMREYTNDCHTLAKPKRTLSAGVDNCNHFLGSMYAQFDIRLRSNTCQGTLCSNLAVAMQTFYDGAGCAGVTYATFKYPLQGECMRANNGTQDLVTSGDDANITLIDYVGSDTCGRTDTASTQKTYSILNKYCYPLYGNKAPRSFMWKVERNKPFATTSARRAASVLRSAFLVVLARHMLW
jgi:hypothetical protein